MPESMPVADCNEPRRSINPLVVAIVGFVAGVLVATTHGFHELPVLHNSWFRLGIAILVGSLLSWHVVVRKGRMRRRVQWCVLLSLLVHVVLALYVYSRHLGAFAEREEQLARLTAEEPVARIVPDYHWQDVGPAAMPEEFEKPVPTELPERVGELQSPDVAVQPRANWVLPAAFLDEPALTLPVVPNGGLMKELRRREDVPVQETPVVVDAGASPVHKVAVSAALSGEAEHGERGAVVRAIDEPSDLAVPGEIGEPRRHESELPVLIAAVDGLGKPDSDRAPLVGIPRRHLRPEDEVTFAMPERFRLDRSGSRQLLEGKPFVPPVAGFEQRQPGVRSELVRRHGGREGTEQAVEIGLDFLVRNQFPDGRWCLDRIPDDREATPPDYFAGGMNCDTAGTGLSLLAFLGAGYTHTGDKHRDTVHRGLWWLVRNQQPNGQLFTRETDATQAARSYGHGMATIALCEAYGMTRDPALREPAQKAIGFILDAQDRRCGGWRYTQPDGSPVWYRESDTSVSGWMLMALKSAQMAGLEVPDDSLHMVSRWLDGAQAHGGALYVYNPHALLTAEQIGGRSPNRAMTAEGLLMRLYLGWQPDNPALVAGAEYLKANPPELATAEQPLRDSYYWYYATQVMFQMQGDYWTTWNERLQAMLGPSQVVSGPWTGSWHPQSPHSDRWAHAGGRLYVTALNLLMLEVYYRHLPLYRTPMP